MVWTVATWIVIAGCGIGLLYILFTLLLRWPGRTVDDVVDFLRPVDLDQLSMLLDPGADFELSWHLDAGTLCEIRRKKMQKYLELLGRMSHNSRILFEFGNRESIRLQASSIGERGARQIQAIAALQSAAVSVRMYSVCAIIILRVLLVVRPTQALSLGKFRKVVEVDGIKSYEELRGACTTVFEEFQRPTDKLVLNF